MFSWQQISTRTQARFHSLPTLAVAALTLLLSGCTLNDTATTHSPVPGPAVAGVAYGGSQPITGAKVYLLAANPGGYGSQSLSLLTTASTGNAVDSIGAYVTTAASTGGFNLAPAGNADYDCTQGYTLGSNTSTATPTNLFGNEQVYLYIKGGNAGSGTNNNIGLLAALGPCNNIYSNTITVNELTTVAAAYALSGYATDATHLASSGSALALTGLSNAGLNSANLVNLATGMAVASTSGITRPVSTIYTLGNILASCIDGRSGNTNCSTLFTYTQSSGTTGTGASDTATAAINLAHNPWPTAAGMTSLYGLIPATGAPFSGGLSSQPNDFTLSLTYYGVSFPRSIAIDSSGNAWIADTAYSSVFKFSSTGTPISPDGGYTSGGIYRPLSVAIDNSGYTWIVNANNSLSKLSSAGSGAFGSTAITGNGLNNPESIAIDGSGNAWVANTSGNSISKFGSNNAVYTGGGLNGPDGIAVDGSGSVWTSNGNNSISKFAPNGVAASSSAGDTGGGLNDPVSIAIDSLGSAWVANGSGNSISKFSNNGTPSSTSAGYTGGGVYGPTSIAIDSSGSAWVANFYGASVSRFASNGTAISPSNGYAYGRLANPYSIAIDGSGDVWAADYNINGASDIVELIGAAGPVVTPLSANLTTPYSAPASKP